MKFYLVQCLIAVALMSLTVTSQRIGLGSCPHKNVEDYFSCPQFETPWFVYAKYPNLMELFHYCTYVYDRPLSLTENITSDRADDKNSSAYPWSTFDVYYRGEKSFFWFHSNVIVNATAGYSNNTNKEAKLTVNYEGNEFPVSLLYTDHWSFALLWSCWDFKGIFNISYFWVLTSERKPRDSVLANIDKKIAELKITNWLVWTTCQNNCKQ